jgi:hypothetical protein
MPSNNDTTNKAAPPDKTASAPFSAPVEEWTPKMKRDYNQQIQEAYDDARASVKDPSKTCTNATGSYKSKCECANCTGARATAAKQQELTGYTPKEA